MVLQSFHSFYEHGRKEKRSGGGQEHGDIRVEAGREDRAE